jgi:hypothetical protein
LTEESASWTVVVQVAQCIPLILTVASRWFLSFFAKRPPPVVRIVNPVGVDIYCPVGFSSDAVGDRMMRGRSMQTDNTLKVQISDSYVQNGFFWYTGTEPTPALS